MGVKRIMGNTVRVDQRRTEDGPMLDVSGEGADAVHKLCRLFGITQDDIINGRFSIKKTDIDDMLRDRADLAPACVHLCETILEAARASGIDRNT